MYRLPLLLAAVLALAGCTPHPVGQQAPKTAQDAPEAISAPVSPSKPGSLPLPQIAFDLVTDAEVSSTADDVDGTSYYTKHYQTATWPGSGSGPTVAIGCDLKMNSKAYTLRSWTPYVGAAAAQRFADCHGANDARSQQLTDDLQDIRIPWAPAWDEFLTFEVPTYMDQCREDSPSAGFGSGYDDLRQNAQGALFSLVYNRGNSIVGPTRLEMRNIRGDVPNKDYDDMADQLRAMKRLWPNTKGLRTRRDNEALLMETPDGQVPNLQF